jgi:hypothetical protein
LLQFGVAKFSKAFFVEPVFARQRRNVGAQCVQADGTGFFARLAFGRHLHYGSTSGRSSGSNSSNRILVGCHQSFFSFFCFGLLFVVWFVVVFQKNKVVVFQKNKVVVFQKNKQILVFMKSTFLKTIY